MKRFCLLLFLLSSSAFANDISTAAVAEQRLTVEPQKRVHAVSLDILGAWLGSYTIRYEYALLPWLTLSSPLYIQTWALAPWPRIMRDTMKSAYGVADLSLATGIGAKFHYAGFYAQPVFKFGMAKFDYRGRAGSRYAAVLEPGIGIGYHYISPEGIYVDTGAALSARFYRPKNAKDLLPKFELITALGYAW